MIEWEILQESYKAGRVPSGIILNAITHDRALSVAEKFAKLLLCQNSHNGESCGKCKSCCYIQQGSHPELSYICKEEGSDVIKIDQIRSLIAKLQQTPLYGHYKVMIIVAAESIHEMAMNALLKTLEQPPGNATIILVTTKINSIPATIKSRCTSLNIARGHLSDIKKELDTSDSALAFADFLASGNTDIIKSLIESDFADYKTVVDCFLLKKVSVADAFSKDFELANVVFYLHKIVILCIKIKQGCEPSFINEAGKELYNLANSIDIVSWYKLYDYHIKLQEELASAISLNMNTMLLELYINWQTIEKNYVS